MLAISRRLLASLTLFSTLALALSLSLSLSLSAPTTSCIIVIVGVDMAHMTYLVSPEPGDISIGANASQHGAGCGWPRRPPSRSSSFDTQFLPLGTSTSSQHQVQDGDVPQHARQWVLQVRHQLQLRAFGGGTPNPRHWIGKSIL